MEERLQRQEEGEPGLDVLGHQFDVLGVDAQAHAAEPERPADRVLEQLAQVAAVGVAGDHVEDEPAGQRVVRRCPADRSGDAQVAQHLVGALGVGQHVEVHAPRRQQRYAGLVAEHLRDGDVALAVAGEGGDVAPRHRHPSDPASRS